VAAEQLDEPGRREVPAVDRNDRLVKLHGHGCVGQDLAAEHPATRAPLIGILEVLDLNRFASTLAREEPGGSPSAPLRRRDIGRRFLVPPA
jgi:hypothetical protein